MEETLQTWDGRIAAVAKVLSITQADVIALLTAWGIEQEPMGVDMLDDDDVCKFGDFQQRFGNLNGEEVKIAKLRLAFKFLKGSKKANERPSLDTRTVELRQRFGVEPTLGAIDTAELLKLYDPTKSTDPVTVELTKRYGDQPVIAFDPDTNQVDIPATIAHLNYLSKGLGATTTVPTTSSGKLTDLLPVGRTPVQFLDEDPLYVGVALRDGRSHRNYVNWSKTSTQVRQFCRLMVDAGLLHADDRTLAAKLAESTYDDLGKLYPDVELDYRRRAGLGTLPTLKLATSTSAMPAKRPNNPFGTNTRY